MVFGGRRVSAEQERKADFMANEEKKDAKAASPKRTELNKLHSSIRAGVLETGGKIVTGNGVEVKKHGRGIIVRPARKRQE